MSMEKRVEMSNTPMQEEHSTYGRSLQDTRSLREGIGVL